MCFRVCWKKGSEKNKKTLYEKYIVGVIINIQKLFCAKNKLKTEWKSPCLNKRVIIKNCRQIMCKYFRYQ